MAYLHIFVDGVEASRNVPRGYTLAILDGILLAIGQILSGKAEGGRGEWLSGPWSLDIRGIPQDNRAFLTLHRSMRIFAMENVEVPLLQLAEETVSLAYQWDAQLSRVYADEIYRPNWEHQYLLFRDYLKTAEEALRIYKECL